MNTETRLSLLIIKAIEEARMNSFFADNMSLRENTFIEQFLNTDEYQEKLFKKEVVAKKKHNPFRGFFFAAILALPFWVSILYLLQQM